MKISNIAGGLAAVYGGYKLYTAKENTDKRNGMIVLSIGVALFAVGLFSSGAPESCEEKFYAFWESREMQTKGAENIANTVREMGRSMGDHQCRHFLYEWKDPIAPSSLKAFERITPEDLPEDWMWGMYVPKFSSFIKAKDAGQEINLKSSLRPFLTAKMTRVFKTASEMLPGTDLYYSDKGVATIYSAGGKMFNRLALNFKDAAYSENFPFNPATNQSAWRGMIDFINKGELAFKQLDEKMGDGIYLESQYLLGV